MNNVKNSVVNPALRGLGAVNPALAVAMNKVGGLRESPTTEAQSTGKSPLKGSFDSDVKEERTPQTENNESPSNVAKMEGLKKDKRNAQKANGNDGKKNRQNSVDQKQIAKQSDKDKKANQLMPVANDGEERQIDGDNTPESSQRKTQAEALLEQKRLDNAEERNKQLEAVDKADRIPEGQQQSLTTSLRTKQENQNETDVNNCEELKPVQKEERIHKNEGGEKENDVRTTQKEAMNSKSVNDSLSNGHLQQVEKAETKSHLIRHREEQNGARSIQTEDKAFSQSFNEHLQQNEKSELKTHPIKPTLQEDRSLQSNGEIKKETTDKKESPLRQKNESAEKQKREVSTEQPVNTSRPQRSSHVSQSQPEKGNERTKKELEAVGKEENRNS